MSEAKPNTEEILRRLSEVLDVLKRISEDLQDISKSLKATAPRAAPPTPQPAKPTGKTVEDVSTMFPKELETMLIFEDKGAFIRITPRQFLGSENFAKIASAVRDAGGEYVSAGRDSHFRIPK
jgi:hypothetical protein